MDTFTLDELIADAVRQGWAWEAGGIGWARLGKWEPVNHAGLAVFSFFTLGLGLFVWAYVASQGPQWRRMIISTDQDGQATVTYLDRKGGVVRVDRVSRLG